MAREGGVSPARQPLLGLAAVRLREGTRQSGRHMGYPNGDNPSTGLTVTTRECGRTRTQDRTCCRRVGRIMR